MKQNKKGKLTSSVFPFAIIVKGYTRRGRQMINSYKTSIINSLHEAYHRPSSEKKYAYAKILCKQRDCNGRNVKITGFSSYSFSMAFQYEEDHQTNLVYFTPNHVYVII